ncbi:MAG: ATP-binding protein [Armatimonadetes bacterium]|jgi:MinD superfamily P-loop ATPase|nr:ATP-binding protein [Armatimonadota bacterium]MDI9601949.1 ATP-binding protein [Acidobacteriota bacterium]
MAATQSVRRVVILSGKGGTGKTTVTSCFADLTQPAVLVDADVDAANLHLMLTPEIISQREFWGAKVAVRDPAKCNGSGECERRCRFDAITEERVYDSRCEGCGLCVLTCPSGALTLETVLSGHVVEARTPYGPLASGRLVPAGESSGKLVTEVRNVADAVAEAEGLSLQLIDGPPGIGCTAIAALAGVDLALLVTEPSASGLHDLKRVRQLLGHFQIPASLIVNRCDINPETTESLRRWGVEERVPLLAALPFDEAVPRAVRAGVPLTRFAPSSPVSAGLRQAWDAVAAWLQSA